MQVAGDRACFHEVNEDEPNSCFSIGLSGHQSPLCVVLKLLLSLGCVCIPIMISSGKNYGGPLGALVPSSHGRQRVHCSDGSSSLRLRTAVSRAHFVNARVPPFRIVTREGQLLSSRSLCQRHHRKLGGERIDKNAYARFSRCANGTGIGPQIARARSKVARKV